MKRLAIALCLCAPVLLAQQEPTPFWLPPPPVKAGPPEQKDALPPVKKAAPLVKRKAAPPPNYRAPPTSREPASVREPAIVREPAPPHETAGTPAPDLTPRPAHPPRKSAAEREGHALIAGETPGALVAEPPAPEPVSEEPRWTPQRFSVGLAFGLWGSSPIDGSDRGYDAAYGLRIGYELLADRVELELLALRASRTAGSAFANASTAHNLFSLRALYLISAGRFTALLGGGLGAALSQTHYSVQDVGGTPVGFDATSGRLVLQVTAGERARLYRGLDVRAEVSALLRDGKLDVLPLLALGWAF